MTITATLTDRYVDATLRHLPGRQRPDIEKELRASIADAIDERLETGIDSAGAEIAVLTELGDPARLAAGYADRPLHLIGPAHYLDYTRLLTALLATVPPVAAAAVALVRTVKGGSALSILADAAGAAITAGVHIAVWTTLFFAVVERVPDLRRGRAAGWWRSSPIWTPAALPEPPSRRRRYAELIAETVMLVLAISLILLSPVVSTETDAGGRPIGMLSPWLWETGVVYLLIAIVVASLGFSYARYYLRWSPALAVAAASVAIAPAITMIWLAASDRLLNPAFVEAAGWPETVTRWVNPGLILLSVGSIIHTVLDATAQARRR